MHLKHCLESMHQILEDTITGKKNIYALLFILNRKLDKLRRDEQLFGDNFIAKRFGRQSEKKVRHYQARSFLKRLKSTA